VSLTAPLLFTFFFLSPSSLFVLAAIQNTHTAWAERRIFEREPDGTLSNHWALKGLINITKIKLRQNRYCESSHFDLLYTNHPIII
jgi:hypothetical protein